MLRLSLYISFPSGSDGKESACNAGDPDSIPRLGRSLGEGNGYALQYSCLDNPHGQRRLVGCSPWGHKARARTRISWSPLSRLKGVQPTLQFGERTRDCSPGQAGKEGPQLARTGASQGFPRAAAPMGFFSRSTTRISGSLSCGAREVRSPCAWRGGARPGSRVTGGD